MFQIDIIGLIPKTVRQKAIDVTIDFVVNLGKGYLSDEITRKIRRLHSDGAFRDAFEDGLQRAANCFVEEYADKDEELVKAIAADEDFFRSEEVQEALLGILKRPGGYLVGEQETLVKSFASVLPHHHNREQVDRAIIFFLKCIAEEVWNLPELRPVYELQFQRITAEATREQVAIQKAQLQASLILSNDIRGALLQLTDVIVQRKLLVSERILHNLPQPEYEHFVGREFELKQIRRLLSPKHRSWVITIDGIGGIGKSALALEVADSYLRYFDKIPEEERFEVIIWTTAKQTVLSSEGIIKRFQSLRTLDDIYSIIAVTLGREDITRVRVNEQDELVRQALTQRRTLLIIDNLETVDDERVMEFILEVPNPTKIIVTTRHRLDIAYPIRLTSMEENETLQLIANEAEKKTIILSDDESKRLFQRTGGVPLAVVWSVAQMGFGHDVEAVLTRLGQPNNDIAKFCFEGTMEHIRGKFAHKLLMALSLFSTDASREALGYVTDLSVSDTYDGLVELEKLSLANKEQGRFEMLPLVQIYSEAELKKDAKLENLYIDRWVYYLLSFITDQGKRKYRSQKDAEIEIDNILGAMDWCWSTRKTNKSEKLETFIKFVKEMNFFLWTSGNWSKHLLYVELGLEAAVSLEKKPEEVNFLYSLATIIEYQDDLDKAQELINNAICISKESGDKSGLAFSKWRLASLQIHQGEYETAKKNLDEALMIANEIKSARHIHLVQHQLARIDIIKENYELAVDRLDQARELLEQGTPVSSWVLHVYRLLGEVSMLQEDFKSARKYFDQGLKIARKIGSQQSLAEAKQSIAKLELVLGYIDKAEQLVHEAIDIFSKLGMKRELRETRALLDQIIEPN